MGTDESLTHATPQTRGRLAHKTTDERNASNRRRQLLALPVYSERLHLMGKIDIYNPESKTLIERKYQLRNIYQGQIYQLWAQYICLAEMGYEVERLEFYEMSTHKTTPIAPPSPEQLQTFEDFIRRFRSFNPEESFPVNPNKCRHCIYCNLCDKTNEDNVY